MVCFGVEACGRDGSWWRRSDGGRSECVLVGALVWTLTSASLLDQECKKEWQDRQSKQCQRRSETGPRRKVRRLKRCSSV